MIFSRWSSSRKICCPWGRRPRESDIIQEMRLLHKLPTTRKQNYLKYDHHAKIHTFLIFHINENVFYDLPLICDVSLRYVLRNILKANLFAVLSKSIVHVQVSLLFIFSRSLSQHLLTNGVYAEAQKLQNQILEQA